MSRTDGLLRAHIDSFFHFYHPLFYNSRFARGAPADLPADLIAAARGAPAVFFSHAGGRYPRFRGRLLRVAAGESAAGHRVNPTNGRMFSARFRHAMSPCRALNPRFRDFELPFLARLFTTIRAPRGGLSLRRGRKQPDANRAIFCKMGNESSYMKGGDERKKQEEGGNRK